MKKHIRLSATVAITCAVALSSAAQSQGAIDIAPYVYPQNVCERPANFTYMPDGESYLLLADDGRSIVKYETATGNAIETIFDASHTRETSVTSINGFILSEDGTKLLVYNNVRPIYRHSFEANYYTFEIKRNILRPLSKKFDTQRAPIFSHDSRMVAFVADNNIHIKKIDYDSEVTATTDGKINSIINGVPDWTYEEEFATDCSMAWAADNLTLSYIRYDESAVPSFSMTMYEGTCDPMERYALYPGDYTYKYPVAGQPNSQVTVHSYDIETRNTRDITPDARFEYIPRIAYVPGSSDKLIITTLNRPQTRMELFVTNPMSTVSRSLLVEESKAWLAPDTYENMTLEADALVLISGRTGYNHLYRYDYSGSLVGTMTAGDWEVTAYYGRDAKGGYYYQSTASGPLNRVVTYVDAKGNAKNISPTVGFSSAEFSPALNYYVLNHNTHSQAPVYTLCRSKDGKTMRTLVDNADFGARFASLPQKEFITIPSDGVELNAYIIKPAGFDPSRRYPVIQWQYSGPGSQEVADRWAPDWYYYAAQSGYVVICADGRGTGYRGRAFMDVVYRDLGHYETIDQLNVARYAASLPYVDAERIGIAGWSFGGYETLMCASADNSPFKSAVAIAAVTDWRYYDTVYAERYMLTPSQNAEGYETSAPINRTSHMNLDLLMMSGTADDNVHLSNTIEYVSHLQADNRLCDMLLFPNMNHSINGCNARALVYANMLRHFDRTLK